MATLSPNAPASAAMTSVPLFGSVATAVAVSAAALPVFAAVAAVVKDPYMDEVFHVPQAVRYCHGDFASPYDPKLTTPPGLYLLTAPLLAALSAMTGQDLCTTAWLRLANGGVFLPCTMLVVAALAEAVHGRQNAAAAVQTAVAVALFPVSFFFHFLYYTDSGSTCLVLLAHLLSLRDQHLLSAAV
ncbi:glucosyltransferase, partial [Cladochytrium tenue]